MAPPPPPPPLPLLLPVHLHPKKLQRVRDHSFDSIMDIEKNTCIALKLQALILSHPNSSLPLSTLDSLSRRHLRLRFRPLAAGSFLLLHPHAFHVFELAVVVTNQVVDVIDEDFRISWANCLSPAFGISRNAE